MGVTVEWYGDEFEESFGNAIGKELVKAAGIFRRNLSTVLRSTGSSKPPNKPSPKGSMIPYNRTGTLARSWRSASRATKTRQKWVALVGTNLMYAYWLHTKENKMGGRNYMNEGLLWLNRTEQMIFKRLDTQRLINVALKDFRS